MNREDALVELESLLADLRGFRHSADAQLAEVTYQLFVHMDNAIDELEYAYEALDSNSDE